MNDDRDRNPAGDGTANGGAGMKAVPVATGSAAGKMPSASADPEVILSVRRLKKYFEQKKGFFGRTKGYVKAVNDVSFDIYRGEVFGLVGESGCGKSTLGLTVLRAYDPTEGEVLLDLGGGRRYDLAKLRTGELKPLRKEIQMIFQDPYSSLSPRMTVREIIGEPLLLSGMAKGKELDEKIAHILGEVGLNAYHMGRYPHAFSGGQRQRIGIARSLIMNPKFIVADEAVSALDVSVQAQIIELLLKLKSEFDLTYLFISHNLSVVRYFCTTVGVMYVGKLVELAPADDLFANPLHPYTEALMSAIPIPNPYKRSGMKLLAGEVPDPSNPPSGCYFHTRCKYAQPVCSIEEPPLRAITGQGRATHFAACHFAGELPLESPLKKQGKSSLEKSTTEGGTS